jgi:GNAT superfamily N-acetyltransferase
MITLRPALESDRKFSRNVHHACYRDVVERQFGSWDEELQRRFFAEGWKEGESQIVERDGVPIGVFRREILDDYIFIREIQIHPRAQGEGMGSEILKAQIDEARARGLLVRLQVLRMNRAAVLYRRLGFDKTDENDIFIFMEWKGGGNEQR